MELIILSACLTVVVALILYAYHETQQRVSERVQQMYSKALEMQHAVIQEIRLIRAQEQTERSQMATERVGVLRTINYLIGELRKDRAAHDEDVRRLIERLRIDLCQCVGDAAADTMGMVRGEAVAIQEMGSKPGHKSVSLEESDTALRTESPT